MTLSFRLFSPLHGARIVLLMMLALGGHAAFAQAEDLCSRAHIFYYNWYGAPPFQAQYVHWPQGEHRPPKDVGSNFYPQLGAYSSTDPAVLKQHMAWIRQARVGVLSLTWWGQDSYEDRGVLAVLDAAADAGLKVNFHLEPYPGRTPDSVARDIDYILKKYGDHRAFYHCDFGRRGAIFYVYESLKHSATEWRPVTDQLHARYPSLLLIAQTSNLEVVTQGGFDGGYTYDGLAPFKHEGFVDRWAEQSRSFATAGKIFIPSIGPGYWDDRAVPVGSADEPASARTRDNGHATTYSHAWAAALKGDPQIITITSFNEWHEGSQIEPAVEHSAGNYHFPPYADGPLDYLTRTAREVENFQRQLQSNRR